MIMKLHAELIFAWNVSHLDSFWNRNRNGPLRALYKNCAKFLLVELHRTRLVVFPNSTYQDLVIWVVCWTEIELAFIVTS